jgi:hypothetical protein
MGRLLKSSGRAQPGQGNELHALARSQRGPFPPVPMCPWDGALSDYVTNKYCHGPREQAKPMSAVSQWLGFVPATVKPWQALIADGADPNAYLLTPCPLYSLSSPQPLLQGGRIWPNATA